VCVFVHVCVCMCVPLSFTSCSLLTGCIHSFYQERNDSHKLDPQINDKITPPSSSSSSPPPLSQLYLCCPRGGERGQKNKRDTAMRIAVQTKTTKCTNQTGVVLEERKKTGGKTKTLLNNTIGSMRLSWVSSDYRQLVLRLHRHRFDSRLSSPGHCDPAVTVE